MSKFNVRDRVSVYGFSGSGGPYLGEFGRITRTEPWHKKGIITVFLDVGGEENFHVKQCRRLVKKKHGKVVSFVKIDDVECGPETTQTFFLPKGVKTIRVGPLIGRHLELGYEVENEPL